VLEELLAILYRPITNQLEALMATVAEMNAKLEALQTSLEQAKDRIQTDVDELRRLLEDRVDPADLDPLIEKLDALTANVQTIDPNPDFPQPDQPPAGQ
jgi:DNA repair ATPase RecN